VIVGGQKKGCSFLKKRTKKLSFVWARSLMGGALKGMKVFLLLFLQKKKILSSSS
jgi:hypothetical protein